MGLKKVHLIGFKYKAQPACADKSNRISAKLAEVISQKLCTKGGLCLKSIQAVKRIIAWTGDYGKPWLKASRSQIA
jgi:hypothetical protein